MTSNILVIEQPGQYQGNVTHCYPYQSFSGLHSPRRSYLTYLICDRPKSSSHLLLHKINIITRKNCFENRFHSEWSGFAKNMYCIASSGSVPNKGKRNKENVFSIPGLSNSRRALIVGLSVAASVILLILMFVLYFRFCHRKRGEYDTRRELMRMSEVTSVCCEVFTL